jgi:hypothetical protein
VSLDLGGRQQRLSINTKYVREWKRVHQGGKSLEIILIRLSCLVVDMEQGSKQQLIVIFSAFVDRSLGGSFSTSRKSHFQSTTCRATMIMNAILVSGDSLI